MAFAEDDVEDFMTDLCTRLERFESYMVSSAIWQDRVSQKINQLEDHVKTLEATQKTFQERVESQLKGRVTEALQQEAVRIHDRITRLHDWIGAVRDELRSGAHVARIHASGTPRTSSHQLPDL